MKHLFLILLFFISGIGYGQLVTDTTFYTNSGQVYTIKNKHVSGVVVKCSDCILEDIEIKAMEEVYRVIQDPHSETSSMITFNEPVSELEYYSGKSSGIVKLIFYHTPDYKGKVRVTRISGDSCKPVIVPPSEWREGLDEPSYTPSKTNTTHIIIHHSATSNSVSDPYSVVRNIYLHHTKTNGWSDIGYNYLIAPDGTIFQGRDSKGLFDPDYTVGAHMCGRNSGTMGICMLGDFTSSEPGQQALKSLYSLIAWKAKKDNIDVLSASIHDIGPPSSGQSKSLKHVTGHRDGCVSGYTECPGDKFFPMMASVRGEVNELVKSDSCGMSSPGQPTDPDPDEPEDDPLIYPNPASTYFSANFKWNSVAIYDLTEKLLLYQKFRGEDKINIENFPAGLYIIQFFKDDEIEKLKLIKF